MNVSVSRRRFLELGGAACLASGCVACKASGGLPARTRGVVVTAKDLSDDSFDWPRVAAESGLTTLSTHIGPKDVLPFIASERGRRFLDACAARGLAVEHELHAMEYLLPRDLFAREPELFRMNEKGTRVPDANCCPSTPRALEIIAANAVKVARACPPTTGRYYFWQTDNGGVCRCPKCRELNGSDQGLLIENAIVRALRAEIDSRATLSHLAYQTSLHQPTHVKPDPALFLEFAPIRRWHAGGGKNLLPRTPLGAEVLDRLDAHLRIFPAHTAQVLEYWLDASLFSSWRKPVKRIPWDAEETRRDVSAYAARGIRHFTTFAVYVNGEYVRAFGADSLDCIRAYADILKNGVRAHL